MDADGISHALYRQLMLASGTTEIHVTFSGSMWRCEFEGVHLTPQVSHDGAAAAWLVEIIGVRQLRGKSNDRR